MDKKIKTALDIEFPVKAGTSAVILLDSNQRAQTVVESISSIGYNQGYLYITIETKNSIYQNIPVKIEVNDNYENGQVLQKGESVGTDEGNYICIAKISEVTSEGIKIVDTLGDSYRCPIKRI